MGAGIYHRHFTIYNFETTKQNTSTGLAFTFGAEFTIGRLSISLSVSVIIFINLLYHGDCKNKIDRGVRSILFKRGIGIRD